MAHEAEPDHRSVPTLQVMAAGRSLAYREFGRPGGVPLVFLNHLGANLDNADPRIMDGLAARRRVIVLGYRGVGGSAGRVRTTIEEMAADTAAAIRALGHNKVDVFGLSMGGMVAQELAESVPKLVDRLVLVGSGPRGGTGLTRMSGVTLRGTLKATATRKDPKTLLFFTRTAAGRTAAASYLGRLAERTASRDKAVKPGVLLAQLAAVRRWGALPASTLARSSTPALILHGDSDRMVPPANAAALAAHFTEAALEVFADSGHGAAFQNHARTVQLTLEFLDRQTGSPAARNTTSPNQGEI